MCKKGTFSSSETSSSYAQGLALNALSIEECEFYSFVIKPRLTFYLDDSFEPKYTWTPKSTLYSSEKNIYDYALHEIGHILQMTHVRDKDALMYPKINDTHVINSEFIDGTNHLKRLSEDYLPCITYSLVPNILSSCKVNNVTNENNKEYTVHPNPVKDILNIAGVEKIETCQIFNLEGKLVLDCKDKARNIDVSGLISGIYVIKILAENKVYISKFIKI